MRTLRQVLTSGRDTFLSLRIGRKLAILVGVLIGGIAVFIVLYFPARQERQNVAALAELGKSIAGMTAFSIAPALVFDDRATIDESFAAARQNQELAFLVVVNDSGRVIQHYNGMLLADNDRHAADAGEGTVTANGLLYVVSSPVRVDKREIGRLYVGLSMENVTREAKSVRTDIAVVSAIVFVVGVFAALLISIIITVPLRRMAQVAARVTAGDLNVRADIRTHDEVGLLADTMNAMLDRLSGTHAELAEVNRTLEMRIERRTRALRDAEEKYRGIFENASVGIYCTTFDGRITLANPTLARILGCESVEVLQATCTFDSAFYVKSGRREELIGAVGARGTVSDYESQVRTSTGAIVWISENVRAVRSGDGTLIGLEGTLIDITMRKAAEESTLRLLRAVEQTDEIVMMTDVQGTITYVNPAFERLYGYGEEEAVGQSPRMLKSGVHDDAFYAKLWREIVDGRSYRGEIVNRRKDGTHVSVEESINPVHVGPHEIVGYIAVQMDITSRKQADQMRHQLERELSHAQKIESIGTLAGGIAHDFNNILAIILGHASLLEGEPGNPRVVAQSVRSMIAAVDRGAGLVKQILTFARKTDVLFEPIRVNGIVQETIRMIRETFPKTIEIAADLAPADPVVNADRSNLHQTVVNLCVNARDAMPKGGRLLLSTSEVRGEEVRRKFPEAQWDRYVALSVSDTGSGMDEETRSRIFEPFFTTKEKGKGTGLGLAVVHGIVKSHDGCIDVESAPGKGTKFTIWFPVAAEVRKSASPEAAQKALPSGNGETILVVEDEEMLSALLERNLTATGFKVVKAGDGDEGLRAYIAHRQSIALVLTDIGLPRMNGHDLFLRIREINPEAKVIVASGYLEPNMRMDLVREGALAVIGKPYILRELLGRIHEALAKK